ncbi:MAG: hypothetical protein ACQESO_09445 [Bacillota bacterium]
MICSYATVDDEKLKALQKLEKDMGRTLLAFSCQEIKPAQLTPEQLERIQALEKDLGFVVVAL